MFVISDKDQPESGKEGKEKKRATVFIVITIDNSPKQSLSVSLGLSPSFFLLALVLFQPVGSDYKVFLIHSPCPALMPTQ